MLDQNLEMGAVTLTVENLETVRSFYEQIIGLQVRDQTSKTAELGTADRPLVRLQQFSDGRFNHNAPGLFHLALRVPTRPDLAHWLRQYIDQGNPNWQGASDHGASEALYLSDPEGNGIEIYRDRPRNEWPKQEDGRADIYTRRLDLDGLIRDTPNQAWARLPAGTDMGHVHLQVNDIPQAGQFYVDTFGFDEITNFRNTALFVSAGGYHHHLGLNIWNSRGAPARNKNEYGLAEYEVMVSDAAERDRIIARLEEAEYAGLLHYGEPTIVDPSGNVMRLLVKGA